MKSILAFLLLLFTSQAFAQLNVSCKYREICIWNERTESFDKCDGYDENSLFRINADETMFVHTTESIQSAYYILETEMDDETGVVIYSVESDVGNPYVYFFDLDNDEIRIAAEVDGEMVMVRFLVKKAWSSKEKRKKLDLRDAGDEEKGRRM